MSRKIAAVALLSTALVTGGPIAIVSLLLASTLLPLPARLTTGSSSGW